MEKKKVSNFTLISFAIILSVGIIIMASIIKIRDKKNKNLLYAMESKIEYYAKRCYLENNCQNEITLKDLYDKNYLTVIVNPVTKEILDENTKINYFNNQIVISWSESNPAN